MDYLQIDCAVQFTGREKTCIKSVASILPDDQRRPFHIWARLVKLVNEELLAMNIPDSTSCSTSGESSTHTSSSEDSEHPESSSSQPTSSGSSGKESPPKLSPISERPSRASSSDTELPKLKPVDENLHKAAPRRSKEFITAGDKPMKEIAKVSSTTSSVSSTIEQIKRPNTTRATVRSTAKTTTTARVPIARISRGPKSRTVESAADTQTEPAKLGSKPLVRAQTRGGVSMQRPVGSREPKNVVKVLPTKVVPASSVTERRPRANIGALKHERTSTKLKPKVSAATASTTVPLGRLRPTARFPGVAIPAPRALIRPKPEPKVVPPGSKRIPTKSDQRKGATTLSSVTTEGRKLRSTTGLNVGKITTSSRTATSTTASSSGAAATRTCTTGVPARKVAQKVPVIIPKGQKIATTTKTQKKLPA